MQEYTELANGMIRRERDGVMFSACVECIEYWEFLEWIAAGNTLPAYEPPIVDPKVAALSALQASDSEMARITEDLYTTLLKAGILKEEDFPKATVAKIKERINLRATMNKK